MSSVIPFGKYSGQTVEDIATADPGYLTWCTSQDWFRDKHPKLVELIEKIGRSADDTPEHNQIQAMFLDDTFRNRVARAVLPMGEGWNVKIAGFENFCDVLLEVSLFPDDPNSVAAYMPIEIKPSVGDDYPIIMRQMAGQASLGHRIEVSGGRPRNVGRWFSFAGPKMFKQVLYVRNNSSSLSRVELRKMFEFNNITLVFEDELHKRSAASNAIFSELNLKFAETRPDDLLNLQALRKKDRHWVEESRLKTSMHYHVEMMLDVGPNTLAEHA